MLKAVPVKPCFLINARELLTFVLKVSYHTHVSFCCQSRGVRCILEQLPYHMILNKNGMRIVWRCLVESIVKLGCASSTGPI